MAHEAQIVARDDESITLLCRKCGGNARFGIKEGMVPFAEVDGNDFAVEPADLDKWLGPCKD